MLVNYSCFHDFKHNAMVSTKEIVILNIYSISEFTGMEENEISSKIWPHPTLSIIPSL